MPIERPQINRAKLPARRAGKTHGRPAAIGAASFRQGQSEPPGCALARRFLKGAQQALQHPARTPSDAGGSVEAIRSTAPSRSDITVRHRPWTVVHVQLVADPSSNLCRSAR